MTAFPSEPPARRVLRLIGLDSPADAVEPGVALRLAAMYAAMFIIFGVTLTYLPVWLDARGLSPAQIAIATSAPLFLRLVATPAVTFAADRGGAHRLMLMVLCGITLGLMLVLNAVPTGYGLIALVALMLVAMQSMMPLSDTITMAAARRGSVDYGRVRLWGSLTFILASYAAGFAVAGAGPQSVIWLMIGGGLLTSVAMFMLPGARPQVAAPDAGAGARARTRSAAVDEGDTDPGPKLALGDVTALLRRRDFVLFLICSGTIQCSHALFYVFGVIHWRSQALSPGFIGSLWAIGVGAEIALFWWAKRAALLGDVTLLALGGASGIVRWMIMALDPPAMMLVPLQVLHGGTFAATHLGAMHWIARHIPQRTAGTAQGLLSTFTAGIAMGSATLMSGPLYAQFGGAAYAAMAVLCGVGLAGALALHRLGANSPLDPDASSVASGDRRRR